MWVANHAHVAKNAKYVPALLFREFSIESMTAQGVEYLHVKEMRNPEIFVVTSEPLPNLSRAQLEVEEHSHGR